MYRPEKRNERHGAVTIQTTHKEGLVFKGKAGEWFGIWIVNLLLTIVTVGIYSAWAKVRTKKYFYQNTYVAGRNFDYHATGMQILIGRIIVVVAILAYSLISAISPILAVLLLVCLIAVFPLLIVRSAAFNARSSSWANVRFNFDGTYGQACKVYLVAAAFVIAGGIGFAIIATPALATANAPGAEMAVVAALMTGYFVLIAAIVFGAILFQVLIRNHLYNHTTLGEANHRLSSSISPGRYVWIAVSNAAVTFLSLGLMLPWAQVRLAKYLADHTGIVPNGSLDDFKGEILASGNAIGDAYSDLEGVDLGLAI
jgi:uncharacterized membrane protein YjgN (DUF898 family)